MQVLESKCTTHNQTLFLPLILVILSCSLCFCVLHLYSPFILGFFKAMAPLQVPKILKFKLFFNNELDVTLDLSPYVASNVQVTSSSTISLSSSSNPKRNMEMERNMLSLLSLLKRNHKGLMRKFVFFKICGHVIFHGLKQLLRRMVWLHKFGVKVLAILKESQSC